MTKAPAQKNEFRHFDSFVPENVMRKVHELAEAAKNDFISDVNFGDIGAEDVSPIYGHSRSGYTPLQLGGYEVSEYYYSGANSGYHITKAQTEAALKQEIDCHKAFVHDYREKLESYCNAHGLAFSADKMDYSIIEAAGLDSQFADYENEWFEPALLRLQIWVESEEDNVHVRLGLNYLDPPYYRSGLDEMLFEFTLTTKQALRMTGESFVKKLKRGIV